MVKKIEDKSIVGIKELYKPETTFDIEYYSTINPEIGIKYIGPFKDKWCFVDSIGNVPKFAQYGSIYNSNFPTPPKKVKVFAHPSGKSIATKYPDKNHPAEKGTHLTKQQLNGLKLLRGYTVEEAECIYQKMQAAHFLIEEFKMLVAIEYKKNKSFDLQTYLEKLEEKNHVKILSYIVAEDEFPYIFSYIVSNAFFNNDQTLAHYKTHENEYKNFLNKIQQRYTNKNLFYKTGDVAEESAFDKNNPIITSFDKMRDKSKFKNHHYAYCPYAGMKLIPGLGSQSQDAPQPQ